MASLFRLMLLEEYRMHVSYSSRQMFISLPLYIFFFAFLFAYGLDTLMGDMGLADIVTLAVAGVFLYGLSVGAFGFLGRTYIERRYGKNNFLVSMPFLLPITFRKVFLGMYLRDVLFYALLMLLPACSAIFLAALLVPYSLLSVALISLSLLLGFLYGMSLSFFISVLYIRSVKLFIAAVAALIALMVGYGAFDLFGLEIIVPILGFQTASQPLASGIGGIWYLVLDIVATIVLAMAAIMLITGEFEISSPKHKESLSKQILRFQRFGSNSTLLAKEFVDIRRGGLYSKMFFAYIVPLVFLSFTTWYVNNGLNIPVGFNAVFYGAMVGFFGILLYSWMTNLDMNDYYETLPVTVPQLVRTKLMAFFILTTPLSTLFVVGISLLNMETELLWLALIVLYCTSVYMIVATAYLTGLNTNSFFFNPTVLTKFTVISLLPDLLLTILSFSLSSGALWAFAGILGVCGVLILISLYFLGRLDKKWKGVGFA